jgi:hypothetical protein
MGVLKLSGENSDQILSILSGHEFEVKPYPADGQIKEPGFYWNEKSGTIEHWSRPCAYNEPMRMHFSNQIGLIQDGFQSILGVDDADQLIRVIQNWNKHLIRYGVVQ